LELWILDADIVIDLLELGIFDKLVEKHEIFTSSIVATVEIKYFYKNGVKTSIDFQSEYVKKGKVKIKEATLDEISNIKLLLPDLHRESIDLGELESMAILIKDTSLSFCCCDAAAIRALPFLNCSERALSLESLLKTSGLSASKKTLKDRHTDKYFSNNLNIGKKLKIEHFVVKNKIKRK